MKGLNIMKASYYTDPVRGKVYRRSYDTLEEAKAYRDEFYGWYQRYPPRMHTSSRTGKALRSR